MKLNRGFVIFVVLFIAFVALTQFLQPKTFVWKPSFHPKDRQPLGGFVFDSVMHQTVGSRYTVEHKSFYQLNHDGTKAARSFLVVTTDFKYNENDLKQMKALLQKGNNIMLVMSGATSTFNEDDTLSISQESQFSKEFGVDIHGMSPFKLSNIKELLKSRVNDSNRYDTIRWTGIPQKFPKARYITESTLTANDTLEFSEKQRKSWEVLSWINVNAQVYDDVSGSITWEGYTRATIAAQRKNGRGELIVVSTPLLFTNYGILNRQSNLYVMRLMSLIADRPIVRTTSYMETDEQYVASQSPTRELLERPPLRIALWIVLIGILLFFIFTARRRQRAIPTITKPANHNLRFIRMIGSLFYQKHRNGDLIEKRWYLFADDVQRLTGLDVTDTADNEHTFSALSHKTGIPKDKIDSIIRELRIASVYEGNITDDDMQRLIKAMNDITERLT